VHVPTPGRITLGETTASELGVTSGDSVTLAGRTLVVDHVMADESYAHRQVAWASIEDWRKFLVDTHQPSSWATVLLIKGSPDIGALDSAEHTHTTSKWQSTLALEAFKSEVGSLGLMIAMLVVIAVLVIGIFFLVWSMQRQRDVAVLKAMGADTGWLARDALGQALLVLLLGTLIGIAATLGLEALASTTPIPFEMNPLSMLVPPIGMVLAGLLGALASLRQITRVDPNQALAAAAA